MVRPEHSNVTTIDLNSPSTYTELVKRRLELRRPSPTYPGQETTLSHVRFPDMQPQAQQL